MKKRNVLGIYCRISRLKEQGKDKSINDQKLLGIAKAKKLGYDYELYIDEGLSAASDNIEDRPEFKRLLEDMSLGKLYAIYGYDQSRFERNPQVHYLFVNGIKEHISEYYTELDGLLDLNNPQVELMSNIVSVFNEYHVTMTKLKVKSVLIRNAREGKAHGTTAYGYTKDEQGYLIIDKEEAEVVRKIYDLSLSGLGTRKIANQLNEEGIPTRYNKLNKGTLTTKNKYTNVERTVRKKDINWSPNTIRSMIKNSLYKGERVYQGEIIQVPAILTPSKWQQVNDNFTHNKSKSSKSNLYNYLLKGKMRCGKCGRNYYGRTRADKKDHTYICSSRRITDGNCGNRGINIDKIEDFIWNRIINSDLFLKILKRDLDFDEVKLKSNEVEVNKRLTDLKTLETKRKRLISIYTNGTIDEDDLQHQLGELTKQTNLLKSDIEHLNFKKQNMENANKIFSAYHKFQNKLDYFKNKLSFEEKQAIVDTFIDNMVVIYDSEAEVYRIDIYFSIHPNDFDEEYTEDYNNDESVGMTKGGEDTYYSQAISACPTSLIVWCGERKGRTFIKDVSLDNLPPTECILVVSRASKSDNGGKIVGNRFANIVFPAPGGPIKITLCPPAAAISKARLMFSCPFTSSKSNSTLFKFS